MFYLACVKVVLCVCVCVCMSVMRACTRVVQGPSKNTNQQSITNVIDELWQSTVAETCIGQIAFCVHMSVYPYVDDLLFSRCHCPGHTHLNTKTHRCNLKPRAWMALL